MRRRDLLRTCAAAPLALAAAAPAQNRYQPTWESIDRRPSPRLVHRCQVRHLHPLGRLFGPGLRAPSTSKDETMYAEWYWNSLTEGKGHGPRARLATWEFHDRVYGADFPYFDFAPMFRAELFDPDHWADVFERSGAKYVALTSKHHEGFTLWRNAEANRTWGRPWNAVDIGPKRDIALDLMEAGRRKRPAHGHLLFALRVVQPAVALRQEALRGRAHVPAVQGRGDPPQAEHHLLRRRVGAPERRMAVARNCWRGCSTNRRCATKW